MSNVVALPGVDMAVHAGQPRSDIAEMLRGIADRAERGEIDALAVVFSIVDGGMATGVSTPENAFYSMLGAVEELKDHIKSRRPDQETKAEYSPDGAA